MKILLVHNFYRTSGPSGENVVYGDERALLEASGAEIVTYECYNDIISQASLWQHLAIGYAAAWSWQTYTEVFNLVRRTRPDVAHFHNTFPLVSPSAYAACKELGVPVVQTLHNYRLICPGGLLLRDGSACEACVGNSLLPALRYRCYRRSLSATAAVVWMLARNSQKGTFANLVDRYICLTRFQAGRFIAAGFPKEKIRIKPNFIVNAIDAVRENSPEKQHFAVYVGSLSEHKGVRLILKAWRQISDFPIKIIGTGPLENELKDYANVHAVDAEFIGLASRTEVLKIVEKAAVQIIPSIWYECFPLVILEAYSCGTPVIASRTGSLIELVDEGRTGLLFESNNAEDLLNKVQSFLARNNNTDWREAILEVSRRYTPRENIKILYDIYGEVLA